MYKYIFLPILAITFGCSNQKQNESEKSDALTDKMKSLVITTDAVEMKGTQTIHLNGKVAAAADARIEIPAIVSGKVKKVYVRRGDSVKKGDILAIISSNDINEIQSEYTAAQSEMAREAKEFEAAQSLFNDGLLSNQELAAAQGEYNVAVAELNRIKEQMAILGNNGSYEYKITSPINGIIEQRSIHADAYVSDDFEDPMFTVTNHDMVIVNLLVSESNIRYMKEGLPVKMHSLSYPDITFEGTISRVVRVLDPESKVMNAKVTIDNTEHLLLPEMFVQSEVMLTSNEDMPAVPSSAIIFDKGRHYLVSQTRDGHYQNNQVKIWGRNNNITYITQGISAGDKIVSEYALLLFADIQNKEKYSK